MRRQIAEVVVHLVELFNLVLFAAERANHAHAGQVFLQHGAHAALGLVGLAKALHSQLKEYHAIQKQYRHQHQRHQRHLDVHVQHYNQRDNQHEHGAEYLDQLSGQESAHGFHVRCAALYQVAGRGLYVIVIGQRLQMPVQTVAHLFSDGLAGLRRPFAAQEHDQAVEHVYAHQHQRHYPHVVDQKIAPAARVQPALYRPGQAERLGRADYRVYDLAQQQRADKRNRNGDYYRQYRSDVLEARAFHEFKAEFQSLGMHITPIARARRAVVPRPRHMPGVRLKGIQKGR